MNTPLVIVFYSLTAIATMALPDDIATIIGDGCQNQIAFTTDFLTTSGDACDSCEFCDGSRPGFIFEPDMESTCISCSSPEDNCNSLRVRTSFDTSWIIKFLKLTSSGMTADTDPNKIVLEASNDLTTWQSLYDSEFTFTSRKEAQDFVLTNDVAYKHYSIKFERKATSSTMHIGQYGLVETYTKHCAANFFNAITGLNVPAYKTSAPTEAPTAEPTDPAPAFESFIKGNPNETRKNGYYGGCLHRFGEGGANGLTIAECAERCLANDFSGVKDDLSRYQEPLICHAFEVYIPTFVDEYTSKGGCHLQNFENNKQFCDGSWGGGDSNYYYAKP